LQCTKRRPTLPDIGGDDYQRRAMIGRGAAPIDGAGTLGATPGGAGLHRWGYDRRAGPGAQQIAGARTGNALAIHYVKLKK